MKKIIFALTAIAVIVSATGCGSSNKATEMMDMSVSEEITYADSETQSSIEYGFDGNYKQYSNTGTSKEKAEAEEKIETESSSTVSRKIIYTSRFNIQTMEFDTAISTLDMLCEKYNAYFESSENYGTAEKANRTGNYTVRVPVENYNLFKNSAGSIGTVIRSSENNTDVTENYFDTEARLASAKLREERLLAILETADTLDNVLLLESELSNVRYEIESLSGKLRKYDSLVSYSTITIYIEEVTKPVVVQNAPKTFGERVSQATKNGFNDFGETVQDITVFVSYNLPSLIMFAIIAIIIIAAIKSNKNKKIKRTVNDTNTNE